MSKIFGYARVSAKDQNLDRQLESLEKCGCDLILKDKLSGKDTNRPEYQLLKKVVNSGDTVIFCELDRLGRNYDDIKNEIQFFDNKGVFIEFLDFPMPKTGDITMDKMLRDQVVNTLAYVAQKEREKINKRQKDGIAVMPVKNGKKYSSKTGNFTGRPSIDYPSNWTEVYAEWKNKSITAKKAMEKLGLKRGPFYKLAKDYESKEIKKKNRYVECFVVEINTDNAKVVFTVHPDAMTDEAIEKIKRTAETKKG